MGDWEDLTEHLGLDASASLDRVMARMGIDDDDSEEKTNDIGGDKNALAEGGHVSVAFTFRVAGISYRQAAAGRCRQGDSVALIPEPHNPHDSNAIRVGVRGAHIGFVPRDQTAALRRFSSDWESLPARVAGVLGSGSDYLTGIEVIVGATTPEPVLDPPQISTNSSPGVQYTVLRTVPLQLLLMSMLSRQDGELPFAIRVGSQLIPPGAKWTREYREDGNDRWRFFWSDPARARQAELPLFTDEECEILMPL